MEKQTCPECGTQLIDVTNCQEYFNRMLDWDFTDFTGVGQVHHLTVLCYYLQHPSHYSVEGLQQAVHILEKVIENKLSDQKLYQEESDTFSSSKRNWSVTGTPDHHGSYSPKITWTITVFDVVRDGMTMYPNLVKKWSQSIYNDLKAVKKK